jgi:hypothetical protein
MVKSKHAMLPSNLFDIQRWVESQTFALRSLMFFCMTLNAVDRAMRFVGLQSKTFEDFENVSDLWRASVLKITYLAQGVREKQTAQAAKEHIYRIHFKPKRCARICNLRHLLLFVRCTNHWLGPLFPKDVCAFGDTPTPPTGTPNDPAPPDETEEDLGISYAELYAWLSARLLKNCQFGHLASFGLHMMFY